MGRRVLQALHRLHIGTDAATHIRRWANPFTVVDSIFNRQSPAHIDREPPVGWLDVLCSIGKYTNCDFECRTFRHAYSYRPGTCLVFNSSRLWHEVQLAEGERMCFVFYLRKHVAEFCQETLPTVSRVERLPRMPPRQ
jgi:hypothetical protein